MITRSHHRRRAGLIVAGVLAMVLGLASSSQARELVGPEATVARPNILVVVTDDQRIGTVTPQIMPNVYSQLVQHGVSFDNGFVTNSWCCPSRASILTGQYSHTNGVWTTGGSYALPAWRKHESNTLATWLHGAGYRTALIGKYLNGFGATAATTYSPPGWDVTDIQMNIDYHGNDGYYNYDDYENGRIVHYGTAPEAYSTRVYTRKVRQFFAADPTDRYPKFAYLAYPSPHGPYTTDPLDTNALSGLSVKQPPNICEADVSDKPRFVRQQPACTSSDSLYSSHLRSQGRMLVSVDRGLGQLFGDLTRTGQIKNTIIIYISDNGWLMKAHRLTGKELPYEESIRVPFLFRWDALGRCEHPSRAVRAEHRHRADDHWRHRPDHPRQVRRHQPATDHQGHRNVVAEGLPGRAPAGVAGGSGRAIVLCGAKQSLQVRRVRHRREGALRPRQRPLRADEPGRIAQPGHGAGRSPATGC